MSFPTHLIRIFILLCIPCVSFAADRHFVKQQVGNSTIAIFVHGFTGDKTKTWGRLPELLETDLDLDYTDFLFWGYPSKLFGRTESLGTIGQHLKTEVDYLEDRYSSVVLIGHSMGGLVIRSFIVQALIDGKGEDLSKIRDVLLFGVPNAGINKADLIPAFVNDQIADVGMASDLIVNLRKYWIQRVTNAQEPDEYNRPIRTLAIAGLEDNFVPKESVVDFFKETAMTGGDHKSMVKPKDRSHLTYKIIKKRLLDVLMESGENRFAPTEIQNIKERLKLDSSVNLKSIHDLLNTKVRTEGKEYFSRFFQNRWVIGDGIVAVVNRELRKSKSDDTWVLSVQEIDKYGVVDSNSISLQLESPDQAHFLRQGDVIRFTGRLDRYFLGLTVANVVFVRDGVPEFSALSEHDVTNDQQFLSEGTFPSDIMNTIGEESYGARREKIAEMHYEGKWVPPSGWIGTVRSLPELIGNHITWNFVVEIDEPGNANIFLPILNLSTTKNVSGLSEGTKILFSGRIKDVDPYYFALEAVDYKKLAK